MNAMRLQYAVHGEDFSRAGEASSAFKTALKALGIPSDIVRRASIAMYEGEMNMVIHANGGRIEALITPEAIEMRLTDSGPGIADIELAMREGYSTASDAVRNLGFGAGMGLPNMKRFTDEMDIRSSPGRGTDVRMKIYL